VRKIILSDDYIRGLIEGEGCFTFCSASKNNGTRSKVPAFVLVMNERDKELVTAIRDHLGIKNKIYQLRAYRKDGYNRSGTVRIMVRDIGTLKNTIVPFFYNKLHGHKRVQFDKWIDQIRNDPEVPESFKLIPRLCRSGFYKKDV